MPNLLGLPARLPIPRSRLVFIRVGKSGEQGGANTRLLRTRISVKQLHPCQVPDDAKLPGGMRTGTDLWSFC